MKRRKQEAKAVFRRLLAEAAIMAVAAAMGFSTEVGPVVKTLSSGSKCVSAIPAANTPMTAAQGAAILRELRAIRELLHNDAALRPGFRRTPVPPQNVKMRIETGWHALGSTHAPVTMVEFTDLQCPFCRRFQMTTFAALKKDYIDTGKVRFIALDMPLPMHAYALGAAEAERCAGDQGRFWQFRDAVLDDQAPPTSDVLAKHAHELGLNLQRFQTCLSEDKHSRQIEDDRQDAAALGIRGTPAFVIGRASDGWIKGISMTGARPLPVFEQEIDMVFNESTSAAAKTHSLESADQTAPPGSVPKVANR